MKEVVSGQKPRIMIVDDDFDVLYTMAAFLDGYGAEVSKFNSASLAVEQLKHDNFDLIFSDIKMPEMTGIDLLSVASAVVPETPFILMTGYGEMDSAIQAIKNGAFDYLLKPIDPDILLHVIDKALTVRRAGYLEKNYTEQLESELCARTAQLRSSLEDLQRTQEKALVAERVKSEFMANVRHELRTPMNVIIGSIDLMLGTPPLSAEQLELLETARSSAADMLELLNRLIIYAELATSRRSQVCERFSFNDHLLEVLTMYRIRAARKGVVLTCDISETVPRTLIGDHLAYQQLVESLVDNAVKFTSAGSVSIKVTSTSINSDIWHIVTEVEDTGIGIPFDRQQEVLKGLSQADGSYTRKYGGIGIGLATANQLVQSLGGELLCESTPGKGSRFCFRIPFRTEVQEGADGS